MVSQDIPILTDHLKTWPCLNVATLLFTLRTIKLLRITPNSRRVLFFVTTTNWCRLSSINWSRLSTESKKKKRLRRAFSLDADENGKFADLVRGHASISVFRLKGCRNRCGYSCNNFEGATRKVIHHRFTVPCFHQFTVAGNQINFFSLCLAEVEKVFWLFCIHSTECTNWTPVQFVISGDVAYNHIVVFVFIRIHSHSLQRRK